MEKLPFQDQLFEAEQPVQEDPYELLVGHERTDKSWKSDEVLRSQYVELTDNLIYKMTDGVNVESFEEPGKFEKSKPDFVVWLDKSARPLAWMTSELWPILAADKDGDIPEMPASRFVNIDREQWVNDVDPNGTGLVNVDLVGEGVIRSLRSIFLKPNHRPQKLDESIDTAPTEFDGKTVLIVDEVIATGRTLDIAKKFFKRAFPEARFATAHWMGGIVEKNGARGNADLPVWYNSEEVKGRGVGNRNEVVSGSSSTRAQRLGRWFLSTRLNKPDELSLKLRSELKKLAHDVREHKVLFTPSLDREFEDFEERVERINGMPFEEWKMARIKQVEDSNSKRP